MIQYVLALAFNKEHTNVVLINKLKPAFQNGKLNGLGGKMENQDYANFFDSDAFPGFQKSKLLASIASQEAAAREFREEAGIDSSPLAWTHVITLFSGELNRYGDKDNWEMYICFTDKLDITKAQTMEKEKVEIYPVSQLPKNIMPNLKWIIPLCLDDHLQSVIEIKER